MECTNAVRASIEYDYGGDGSDPTKHGFIISNNPPVVVSVSQPSQGTVDCGIYLFSVVMPQVTWSLPNRQGIETYRETRITGSLAFGPIIPNSVTVISTAAPGTYYGVTQEIFLSSRGPFRGYERCSSPGSYKTVDDIGGGLIPGAPAGSTAQNAYYPLFDVANVKIQGVVRIDGPYDPSPCTFTVIDTTGMIYRRTEASCPTTIVRCEGTCLPGGSRIGGCCVDCSDLTGNLEAIRQAMRRL